MNRRTPMAYRWTSTREIITHNLGRRNNEVFLDKGEKLEYRGGYYFREMNIRDNRMSYEIDNQEYIDIVDK